MPAAQVETIRYIDNANNHYKVDRTQWNKWNPQQRNIFEHVYSSMVDNPEVFQHPESLGDDGKTTVPHDHWSTTAWNAAWVAADACGEYA